MLNPKVGSFVHIELVNELYSAEPWICDAFLFRPSENRLVATFFQNEYITEIHPLEDGWPLLNEMEFDTQLSMTLQRDLFQWVQKHSA